MGDEAQRLLTEQGLRFLGGLTAGQAHEVTNVLNVINELSGLMDDLLAAGERGRPVDPTRLRTLTQKIAAQVSRGERLVRNINLFAHSADEPLSEFDVTETMERIAFIAQRAARLGRTRLLTVFPKASVTMESNLLGFENAVYLCIEIALGAATEKRLVTLRYDAHDTGVEIEAQTADGLTLSEENRPQLRLLTELAAALGGQVSRPNGEQNTACVALSLPRRARPSQRSDATLDSTRPSSDEGR